VHTEFIQVPFVIGGIGFFHSVPASYGEIDLDACLLAKIFNRDITRWDDDEIVALNPNLASLDQPITVARRVYGSSSTSLITKYLNQKCPEVWAPAATMVGKEPCSATKTSSCVTWASDTVEAEGSGGISGYLEENPYSISYIDNGHGLSSGLGEIALKNADGNFVKPSTEDAVAGAALGSTGTLGATRDASLYTSTWADVTLMDQAGESTWPICTFSYMYIKKDMSGWTGDDAKTAALVKAFAQFVLSEEAQLMLPEFGFVGLPSSILLKARTAVNAIALPDDNAAWKFETDTNKDDAAQSIVGQYPLVFSSKRRAYADYERSELVEKVAALQAQVTTLQAEHVTLHPRAWYDDPTKQIEGAAAVGALGFIFGFIGLVLGAVAMTRVKGLAKNASGGYQI
jgi:ABC-type phosphate transport system substrate-binding protein